jgi:hypothetical protein
MVMEQLVKIYRNPGVTTVWLLQVVCKVIRVFQMHTRLTANAVLKDLIKRGDSQVTETNLL